MCGSNAGAGATCGPVISRALLNSLFPPGSLGRNNGVAFLDNPDRVVPRTDQISLGYEHQVGSQMAATVDYIHSWNRDQLITFDLNPGQRVDTSRTGRIVYTDLNGLAQQLGISPFTNQLLTRTNAGSSQFDGMNVSVEKRYDRGWAARLSYALGYARGNSEANQTFLNNYQVLNDPRLDANFGPLDADRRQNLGLSGRVEIPGTHGLMVSGASRFMTGSSMTLINSAVDADRNGLLFDLLGAGQRPGLQTNGSKVQLQTPPAKEFDGRGQPRAVQYLQRREFQQSDGRSASVGFSRADGAERWQRATAGGAVQPQVRVLTVNWRSDDWVIG